jgi:hypothetical protein
MDRTSCFHKSALFSISRARFWTSFNEEVLCEIRICCTSWMLTDDSAAIDQSVRAMSFIQSSVWSLSGSDDAGLTKTGSTQYTICSHTAASGKPTSFMWELNDFRVVKRAGHDCRFLNASAYLCSSRPARKPGRRMSDACPRNSRGLASRNLEGLVSS